MNQSAMILVAAGIALVFAVYLIHKVIRAGPLAVFSRICLLAACGMWLLLAAVVMIAAVYAAPQMIVVAVVALIYFGKRKYFGSNWTHGTARWADAMDLVRVGMLGTHAGVILGKVRPPSFRDALRLLRRMPWRHSQSACQLFFAAMRKRGLWVRWANGCHSVIFAPTGAGKGVSFVIPTLLTDSRSAVVIDPKGENALATAAYRRDVLGHRVVILDPFKIVTDTPDTFNPIAALDPDSPTFMDAARSIADAMVIRTGEEREPHWADSATVFIWAMIVFVVTRRAPVMQNLQIVAEIMASAKKLDDATDRLSETEDALGSRLAHQLRHFVKEERGSVLTTANRFLHFLCTLPVMESTIESSFDPAELKTGRMTIYLVLPTEHLRSQSALLRVWISSLLRSIVQQGPGERNQVLFLLDEAAALGKLDCLDDALYQLRGYGVRLMYLFQNIGQLKRCFPDDEGQGLLANTDLHVFIRVNDLQTAEMVSQRCGSATVQSVSANWGTSRTRNFDPQGLESGSLGENSGGGMQDMSRELLKKEEVMQLGERTAVVFIRGMPPLLTRLTRYYESGFADSLTPGSRLWLAVKSLVIASVSAGLVALAGMIGIEQLEATRKQYRPVTPLSTPPTQSHPKQRPFGR